MPVVKMHAADEVHVASYFSTESARYNFLKHGEAENIVRKSNICIIRPHRRDQVNALLPNEKLEGCGTRYLVVFVGKIFCIEELNYCSP